MRQSVVARSIQLLKHWLYNVQSSIVVEKIWALSVDQCWLQALQFSVYLIYLLHILLRCNGFTRIQKAVVDQTSSRPPNSDHEPFFDAILGLGSALELLGLTTELVATTCCIKSLHITTQSKNDSLLCRR